MLRKVQGRNDSRDTSPSPKDLADIKQQSELRHPYMDILGVLATKHDKLPLIAPPFLHVVSFRIETIDIDTDTFGTFTGEIPRQGSPLDTAIAKARLGIETTGVKIGLASEGTIAPDPEMPFLTVDREIVVLVDEVKRIIVWESQLSYDVITTSISANATDDLTSFLSKADFPNHHLIVRPNTGTPQPVYKGISDIATLTSALHDCANASPDGLARIETDLRANHCPSRRPVIAAAAERLAGRIATCCPACNTPGWGIVDIILGIPCAWCGSKVPRPQTEIQGCPACRHREYKSLVALGTQADPSECSACNP